MPAIIPRLVVENAALAADFYQKAFGAEELGRIGRPDGRLVRVALRICGCLIYVSDMAPEFGGPGSPNIMGGTTCAIHVETPDPDLLYDRVIAAGATPVTLIQTMFWGERQGLLRDPFGHRWSIAAAGDRNDLFHAQARRRTDG